jgi:uncharacterized protein
MTNDFIELRKAKHRMGEAHAWELLCSREVVYGFLGTCGLTSENGMPYIVPMNFAAEPEAHAVYLHTTLDADSKRNRAVRENPIVTFAAVHPDAAILPDADGIPCKFSMKFRSVMVFGAIAPVEDQAEKARILNFFMKQKSGAENLLNVPPHLAAVATIYKISVDHISGAQKD